MRDNEITDKNGNTINRGDYVVTKIRGGTHEGNVSKRHHLMMSPWLILYALKGNICANSWNP